MPRQERRAEAGGERRLRILHALLGAGDLGGVAREEVIHRLGRVSLAIGGITPKASAVSMMMFFGMPGAAGLRGVGDEIERIGGAGVLGLGAVVEIRNARDRIDHHVFHDRAEAVRGRVDLRLRLGREPDALGVAAALEIEHALRAPAMLVVADQRAFRIGRERGLAGAGEAEEQRDVARGADVGRAVHRHHAFGRQIIIERGEDRLLHLAGIAGAADQHDLAREIDGDDRLAAAAVALRDRP